MAQSIKAEVIFTPATEQLRYLTEGPYRMEDGRLSWVAIQHGPQSEKGSLNLLDVESGENQTIDLPGRPGFAFPTSDANRFIVGMERQVAIVDVSSGETQTVADGIDSNVTNTIINDGLVYRDQLIFGCKELEFETKKAGLFLMRPDHSIVQLADDQICSNGKAIREQANGTLEFFDICSCSKQVVAWDLDLDAGTIANRRVVVDLTAEEVFPDGMILTPDEESVIVAIFNPGDADEGEARQYNIASGDLETVWLCPGSPRVTCPQLIHHHGETALILTTADEGMDPALKAKSKNAGCLFVGKTTFDGLNDCPRYSI